MRSQYCSMHSCTLAIQFTRILYYVYFEWQLKYIHIHMSCVTVLIHKIIYTQCHSGQQIFTHYYCNYVQGIKLGLQS